VFVSLRVYGVVRESSVGVSLASASISKLEAEEKEEHTTSLKKRVQHSLSVSPYGS